MRTLITILALLLPLVSSAAVRQIPADVLKLKTQASIATPASGYQNCAIKTSDGQLYCKNSGGTETAFSTSSGSAMSVLTKTANYTVDAGDFSAGGALLVICNGTTDVTLTLPAASNTGYSLYVVNIGTATCNVTAAGSDTIGDTTETSLVLVPGGLPPSSNQLIANGGSLWSVF